jgi:hypothetical protein
MKLIKLNLFFILLIVNYLSAQSMLTISQDFLYAVRTDNQKKMDSLQKILAQVSMADLKMQLENDDEKIAFWLNVYNANIQFSLSINADLYKKRSRFFSKRQIKIAGRLFSFDEIEHGILRKSKIKLSLGYLNKLFESKQIKALRVSNPNYRIHFALNCGAESCPPIAYYEAENINEQLNIAEKAFITSNTTVNDKEKTIYTSKIFSWFRGDFGGKSGIKKLLLKHNFPKAETYKLKFKDYSWNLELKKYVN